MRLESVEVIILGQKYLIRGHATKEYLRQLAEFVDNKVREVYRRSPGTTPLKAAILTALVLSDELNKINKEHSSVTKSMKNIEQGAESLLSLID